MALQKNPALMIDRDDPDVSRLRRRAEAVADASRRMKVGLRFRRSVAADGHKGLAASYDPEHFVLEHVAPHFIRQLAHEDWVITTPYRRAWWDGRALSSGPGSSAASRSSSTGN